MRAIFGNERNPHRDRECGCGDPRLSNVNGLTVPLGAVNYPGPA